MKNLFQQIDFTNFKSFLNNKTVLVDYWAEWCHPCKLQHRILEKMAFDYDDKIQFARLNIDDNKVIASEQNVRNLPAIVIYKNGVETRRLIGLQTEEMLRSTINDELKA
jgi:thioredoxin 1